jgi:hypothetical protein
MEEGHMASFQATIAQKNIVQLLLLAEASPNL